jgi:hypothetical protein
MHNMLKVMMMHWGKARQTEEAGFGHGSMCATESEAFQEGDASDSVTRLSCAFCVLTMERR